MTIRFDKNILRTGTDALLKRTGYNLTALRPAVIGNPLAETAGEAVFVDSSDRKGLVFIHGVGADPQSVYTAVNKLRQDETIYGTPVLVKKTANGFVIETTNPDEAPEFFAGVESRNDQSPVYPNQIMYGTLHPVEATLQLLVIGQMLGNESLVDQYSGIFSTETVQDTDSANITAPASNNRAKGILIQIDHAGALTYKQSGDYVATITLPQAYRAGLLPEPDGDRTRVGYAQWIFGAIEFSYADIWEVPDYLSNRHIGNPKVINGTFVIPAGRQMIVSGQMTINGQLIPDGELVVL